MALSARILSLVSAALLLTTALPAQAVVMLDQEYDPPSGFPAGGGPVGQQGPTRLLVTAQTFTVGKSGVLESIAVQLFRNAAIFESITLDIRTPNGSLPGLPSATLASATLTAREITAGTIAFVSFDLSSANFAVSSGDFLSFVLSSPTEHTAPASYQAFNSGVNGGYAGGDGFAAILSDGTNFSNSLDWKFRSFVDVTVPEPGTLALFGLGLAGIGVARRRR